jgi:hypothetical protein
MEVTIMSGNKKSTLPVVQHQSVFFLLAAGLLLASSPTKADYVFGPAGKLGAPVNSPGYEWMPRVHLDGLSMTVSRNFDDESETWTFTRPTKNAPWDAGVCVETLPAELQAIGYILPGYTTMDGLEVYGWFPAPDGYGEMDIYVWTRESVDLPFVDSEFVNIGPVVNTQYDEGLVTISGDGLELIFSDYDHPRPGGQGGEDLWVTRRATRHGPWKEPVNLGSLVNSQSDDSRAHISVDSLLLFFDSRRPGGSGKWDIYMTRRTSVNDPWQEAVNLGPEVNSAGDEFCPCISPDGREFFFTREEDIWYAPVLPIVDFNVDGVVDCLDVCDLVNHWGTDNSLYDIGPTPFGDGVVDGQDLVVLADHISPDTGDSDDVE